MSILSDIFFFGLEVSVYRLGALCNYVCLIRQNRNYSYIIGYLNILLPSGCNSFGTSLPAFLNLYIAHFSFFP